MDSTARRIETAPSTNTAPTPDEAPGVRAPSAIDDLLDGLTHDPEEAWDAFQGLESLDPDLRRHIVEELVKAATSEGLIRLLHMLGACRDAFVRATARKALGTDRPPARPAPRTRRVIRPEPAQATTRRPESRLPAVHQGPPRLIRSLATAVDGEGVGAIVVASVRDGRTTAAAFLCDVRRGIVDAMGETDDAPDADVDPFARLPEFALGRAVENVPALAVGLLAGSLMLSGRETPARARDWLDATLGRGFHAGAFLAARPEWSVSPTDAATLADRSWRILEACPNWVDRSELTFDLAEEITVRERRAAADPLRDAGAYRFLFERRILHRLELYRRMLLWMAFFWDAADDPELSLSAGVLAGQLADPQYAVPSHPFTVALTTRSLHEAQRQLGAASDPRRA